MSSKSNSSKNIETVHNDSKKVEENSCTDSGFLSGFQDSCEISSNISAEADKPPATMGGISQKDDKENYSDSGIISSDCVLQTESRIIKRSPYIPDYLTRRSRLEHHLSNTDKYFEQDEDGYTKLHIAILHDVKPVIEALLTYASDSSLNIRNFCGQTALHLAVLLGQYPIVRQLIDAGIDVNIRDNRCNTALHLACLNGDLSSVHTIISAVNSLKDQVLLADLEQWNYEGETCFFIACRERNFPIMKALELNGANVNAREGRSGNSPLHMAIEMKAKDVIKFLCEECRTIDINIENYSGLTAFQLSLLTNQEQVANYLLKKGAIPYFTSEDSDIDEDSSDYSGDELEQNQIINKIAEIAVN